MTQYSFAVDSLTAGSASAVTSYAINPDPTHLHTVIIPLITGLLAPLIKEIIISLRENRKRKKEEKQNQESKTD